MLVQQKRSVMHATSKAGVIALLLSLMSFVAEAGTLEGAGIGAGVGAVVAGPPAAIVGGVLGVAVGGPNSLRGTVITADAGAITVATVTARENRPPRSSRRPPLARE